MSIPDWIGYVSGPPLIGQLAGIATRCVALTVIPALTGAIALITRSPRVPQ